MSDDFLDSRAARAAAKACAEQRRERLLTAIERMRENLRPSCSTKIAPDGRVSVENCLYWSRETLARAGQEVAVVPHEPGAFSIILIGDLGEEVHADLIDDAVFRASDAGQKAALEHKARREAKRASVVSWQAEALIELVDQRIEHARLVQQSIGARLVTHLLGYFQRDRGGAGHLPLDGTVNGDLEFAQDRDVSLQLAEAIFQHPHALLDGHFQGRASNSFDNHDANPAGSGAHRLCEERI